MVGIRLIILSAALCAAAGITAGTLRSVQQIAPAPALESPQAAMAKADRLALPQLTVADRWTVPPAPVAPTAASTLRTHADASPVSDVQVRTVKKTDPICGARGRRHFIRHHRQTWRCRR
jgi:hypothetical protein